MKLSISALTVAFYSASQTASAFAPISSSAYFATKIQSSSKNYNDELYAPDATPDIYADSREANALDKDKVSNAGVGSWETYKEFDEFDGGDGQMGVAGDGQKGLDKSEFETGSVAANMNKSRARSAKNAWGSFSTSEYADSLRERGVDTSRAQQLENWANQQEIKRIKDQQKYMTEQFDQVSQNADADWRTLAKFGVERNADFDMDSEFGPVTIDGADMEGTIELQARPGTMAGGVGYHDIALKNPYMGFADFRAAFTPESGACWSVDPGEGSLSKEPTSFQIKFRPDSMGTFEGYLVIQTEDFKKCWHCIGTTGV